MCPQRPYTGCGRVWRRCKLSGRAAHFWLRSGIAGGWTDRAPSEQLATSSTVWGRASLVLVPAERAQHRVAHGEEDLAQVAIVVDRPAVWCGRPSIVVEATVAVNWTGTFGAYRTMAWSLPRARSAGCLRKIQLRGSIEVNEVPGCRTVRHPAATGVLAGDVVTTDPVLTPMCELPVIVRLLMLNVECSVELAPPESSRLRQYRRAVGLIVRLPRCRCGGWRRQEVPQFADELIVRLLVGGMDSAPGVGMRCRGSCDASRDRRTAIDVVRSRCQSCGCRHPRAASIMFRWPWLDRFR
jgi:hypothetical protein